MRTVYDLGERKKIVKQAEELIAHGEDYVYNVFEAWMTGKKIELSLIHI